MAKVAPFFAAHTDLTGRPSRGAPRGARERQTKLSPEAYATPIPRDHCVLPGSGMHLCSSRVPVAARAEQAEPEPG